MEQIKWSESLSVGIDSIDEQHRNWIGKFNSVLKAVEDGRDQAAIISTVDFLLDYTDEHFATEEAYMKDISFPGLEEHRSKHEQLKSTVSDIARDYRDDGVSQQLADALGTLMGNWLVSHIREMDMAYAEHSAHNS